MHEFMRYLSTLHGADGENFSETRKERFNLLVQIQERMKEDGQVESATCSTLNKMLCMDIVYSGYLNDFMHNMLMPEEPEPW